MMDTCTGSLKRVSLFLWGIRAINVEGVGGNVLSGRVFDPEAQARILQNKHVLRVSETTITYCPVFKVQAVRANLD